MPSGGAPFSGQVHEHDLENFQEVQEWPQTNSTPWDAFEIGQPFFFVEAASWFRIGKIELDFTQSLNAIESLVLTNFKASPTNIVTKSPYQLTSNEMIFYVTFIMYAL